MSQFFNRASRIISLALLIFAARPAAAKNPIIQDLFTADPAALVHGDTVYLYTGHDEAKPGEQRHIMYDWLCFSSTDMVNWKSEGSPLSVKAFTWSTGDAWASQVVERDGKFYWYVSVSIRGEKALGVAVADSPTGPFTDAIGKPLVTNDMTKAVNKDGRNIPWDDIDPTVLIDDDGQAYLIWGNTQCHAAKLKPNMTELDGPIVDIALPDFNEAPWIHKYKGTYYLSYAYRFPEKIAYATADHPLGPYTFQSVINDVIPNGRTNHQSIIEFKGKWFFVYHTTALSGDEMRRSVCIERLDYNNDGSIKPITQTETGITLEH